MVIERYGAAIILLDSHGDSGANSLSDIMASPGLRADYRCSRSQVSVWSWAPMAEYGRCPRRLVNRYIARRVRTPPTAVRSGVVDLTERRQPHGSSRGCGKTRDRASAP